MAGPCSLPEGNRALWNEMNEIVCDTHFVCWPGKGDMKQFAPCDLITYRMWLLKRGRLTTGKTV